ncbi:MAG: ACP phosphodiesterase [Gemmatimonadota bacterium]|nr:ACP phosphodiesterase [Gemmatimonadota bacterium]
MNYLAHLYFAEDTPESRVGNLMVDFVRGPVDRQPYNGAVMRGMRSHVAVDRYTDGHDVFRESKALISSSRRRFAGIIVDICYDHFLASHWSAFSNESLADFIDRTYGSLRAYRGDMPPVLSRVLNHMVKNDWLGGYREMSGISRALDGLSMRIRRPNTLAGSVEELEANYDEMEEQFLRFFPDLVQHMEKREHAREGGKERDDRRERPLERQRAR